MRTNKRKCKVCEKEVNVKRKAIGRHGKKFFGKANYEVIDSDEGVLFMLARNSGVWFCNSCWEKMLKYNKKQFQSKSFGKT